MSIDQSVVDLLKKEIPNASPVVTGISVACVLMDTHRWSLSGTNSEYEGSLHAEHQALQRLKHGRQIESVHLMSSREGYAGLKHALPCRTCADRLWGYVAKPKTAVHLYDSSGSRTHELPLWAICSAYPDWMAELPQGPVTGSVTKILAECAPHLSLADDAVLKHFLTLVRGEFPRMEFYLTGSALGTGGARGLLNHRVLGTRYQDIDLVLIDSEARALSPEVFCEFYNTALRLAGIAASGEMVTQEPDGESRDSSSFLDAWIGWSDFAIGMERPDYRRLLLKPQLPVDASSDSLPGVSPIEISLGSRLQQTMSYVYLSNGWYRQMVIKS